MWQNNITYGIAELIIILEKQINIVTSETNAL